ncbi:unnamed protein product, partial [Iphiclides podalirius]
MPNFLSDSRSTALAVPAGVNERNGRDGFRLILSPGLRACAEALGTAQCDALICSRTSVRPVYARLVSKTGVAKALDSVAPSTRGC